MHDDSWQTSHQVRFRLEPIQGDSKAFTMVQGQASRALRAGVVETFDHAAGFVPLGLPTDIHEGFQHLVEMTQLLQGALDRLQTLLQKNSHLPAGQHRAIPVPEQGLDVGKGETCGLGGPDEPWRDRASTVQHSSVWTKPKSGGMTLAGQANVRV